MNFITLIQFLDESMDDEFTRIGDHHELVKNFGDHKLNAAFTRMHYNPLTGQPNLAHHNHYEFAFSTNGNFGHRNDTKIPLGTRANMGHFVGKVLHHFIKKHQPESINFSAYNERHEHHFGLMAKAVANATGYEHVEHNQGWLSQSPRTIHFLHRK